MNQPSISKTSNTRKNWLFLSYINYHPRDNQSEFIKDLKKEKYYNRKREECFGLKYESIDDFSESEKMDYLDSYLRFHSRNSLRLFKRDKKSNSQEEEEEKLFKSYRDYIPKRKARLRTQTVDGIFTDTIDYDIRQLNEWLLHIEIKKALSQLPSFIEPPSPESSAEEFSPGFYLSETSPSEESYEAVPTPLEDENVPSAIDNETNDMDTTCLEVENVPSTMDNTSNDLNTASPGTSVNTGLPISQECAGGETTKKAKDKTKEDDSSWNKPGCSYKSDILGSWNYGLPMSPECAGGDTTEKAVEDDSSWFKPGCYSMPDAPGTSVNTGLPISQECAGGETTKKAKDKTEEDDSSWNKPGCSYKSDSRGTSKSEILYKQLSDPNLYDITGTIEEDDVESNDSETEPYAGEPICLKEFLKKIKWKEYLTSEESPQAEKSTKEIYADHINEKFASSTLQERASKGFPSVEENSAMDCDEDNGGFEEDNAATKNISPQDFLAEQEEDHCFLFKDEIYDAPKGHAVETDDKTDDKVEDETVDETDDKTDDETDDKTDDETDDKTDGETDNKTDGETDDETDDETNDETNDEMYDEMYEMNAEVNPEVNAGVNLEVNLGVNPEVNDGISDVSDVDSNSNNM